MALRQLGGTQLRADLNVKRDANERTSRQLWHTTRPSNEVIHPHSNQGCTSTSGNNGKSDGCRRYHARKPTSDTRRAWASACAGAKSNALRAARLEPCATRTLRDSNPGSCACTRQIHNRDSALLTHELCHLLAPRDSRGIRGGSRGAGCAGGLLALHLQLDHLRAQPSALLAGALQPAALVATKLATGLEPRALLGVEAASQGRRLPAGRRSGGERERLAIARSTQAGTTRQAATSSTGQQHSNMRGLATLQVPLAVGPTYSMAADLSTSPRAQAERAVLCMRLYASASACPQLRMFRSVCVYVCAALFSANPEVVESTAARPSLEADTATQDGASTARLNNRTIDLQQQHIAAQSRTTGAPNRPPSGSTSLSQVGGGRLPRRLQRCAPWLRRWHPTTAPEHAERAPHPPPRRARTPI